MASEIGGEAVNIAEDLQNSLVEARARIERDMPVGDPDRDWALALYERLSEIIRFAATSDLTQRGEILAEAAAVFVALGATRH